MSRTEHANPVPPAGHVAVPSWMATHEMLVSWGFAVEVTEKVMGSKQIIVEGVSQDACRHAAWVAGFTFQQSMPASVRAEMAAEKAAQRADEAVASVESFEAMFEVGAVSAEAVANARRNAVVAAQRAAEAAAAVGVAAAA